MKVALTPIEFARRARRLYPNREAVIDGEARYSYEDFLAGFVTKDGQVWGRPVGVAIAKDGSMFVTDDGSRSVWHVTYIPK